MASLFPKIMGPLLMAGGAIGAPFTSGATLAAIPAGAQMTAGAFAPPPAVPNAPNFPSFAQAASPGSMIPDVSTSANTGVVPTAGSVPSGVSSSSLINQAIAAQNPGASPDPFAPWQVAA